MPPGVTIIAGTVPGTIIGLLYGLEPLLHPLMGLTPSPRPLRPLAPLSVTVILDHCDPPHCRAFLFLYSCSVESLCFRGQDAVVEGPLLKLLSH